MRTILGIILLIDVYVIVYYRLLVRFEYEKKQGNKESTFGALFSFPPYSSLPEKGKAYAKTYWIAVCIMIACIGYLAMTTHFAINK